mgnify:CR=1 FL=1
MIVVRLDRMMAERKMSLRRLSQAVDISEVNLSKLKNGHVKSIRFDTLNRLCKVLECTPKDLLDFRWDQEDIES